MGPRETEWGTKMKKFAQRIALVAGALAVSVGLVGGTAGTAQADSSWPAVKGATSFAKDSSWPA